MNTRTLTICTGLAAAILASGCVVRTQDFHCVMDDNPSETFEMAMSPTSLVYRSQRLPFAEERGADRLYRSESGAIEVLFSPPSQKLIARTKAGNLAWTCKRYEPL